ncbi:hypothetical protein [Allohahella marinimesophila]|uniref:Multidrug transporter n=1 Tax=Allohahella marinimesophila TaxID=1054972 RepID=A0ABP7NRE4_9GAMM
MKIEFDASAIGRILGVIALLLILASLGGQLSKYLLGHDHLKGFVPLFSVDGERNVPTFFSVLLLLLNSSLLAVIASLNMRQKAPHSSKWVILSLGFLFMAFDEGFSMHEKLITPFRSLMGDQELGIFYFAWVIPAIALVLILGLFFLKFLMYLHVRTRLRFVIAGAAYLGGAIGVELIGGGYAELYGYSSLTYSMIVTAEEGLELTGLILFIRALVNYLAEHYRELRVAFSG